MNDPANARLQKRENDRIQREALAAAGVDDATLKHAKQMQKAGGDSRSLRGIPCIGLGVRGAMNGSVPDELSYKNFDRWRDRDGAKELPIDPDTILHRSDTVDEEYGFMDLSPHSQAFEDAHDDDGRTWYE